MKVKSIEILCDAIDTVGDLVKELLFVPTDYSLHPLRQKCGLIIDNLHECVYLDDSVACEKIRDEIFVDTEEIEADEKKCMVSEFYVVMGYDEQERASLLGLFSSEEAATQCGQEHLDCENIMRYEIENPTLDEFGFK